MAIETLSTVDPETLFADILNDTATLLTFGHLAELLDTQPAAVASSVAKRDDEDVRAIIDDCAKHPILGTSLLEGWLKLIPLIAGDNLRQTMSRVVAANAASQTATWREAMRLVDDQISPIAGAIETYYIARQHAAELQERYASLQDKIAQTKREDAELSKKQAELESYKMRKNELLTEQLASLRRNLEIEKKEFERLKNARDMHSDALVQAHQHNLRTWLEYLETFEARARRFDALPEKHEADEALVHEREALRILLNPTREDGLRRRTEHLFADLLSLANGSLEKRLRQIYEEWGTQ